MFIIVYDSSSDYIHGYIVAWTGGPGNLHDTALLLLLLLVLLHIISCITDISIVR